MVVRDVRRSISLRRGRVVDSPYLQVLALGAGSVLGPLLLAYVQSGIPGITIENSWNTQFASLIAAIGGYFAHRRVSSYPGTGRFSYVLPAFMSAYGIMAAILLLGRFAYSGAMLLTGAVVSTVLMFVLVGLGQRGPMRFYVVPGGEHDITPDAAGVAWIPLTVPEIPKDSRAAIVADFNVDHEPEWERLLATAAISGRVVYHIKQLRESLTGRVQIDHLSENHFGSLLPNRAYSGIKRIIDVAVTLLVGPLLLLPILVVALAVRLDSPGPVLFRQLRMGYRGKPFWVVKFRTMRQPDPGRSHDPITRERDDRITPLGRILRRTRIDELPQLWNVLKGEMSLIGPRPEALALSEWYEGELPFYVYRHIVRPGITGWAQINQGHVAELDDVLIKLNYDFYYIKNFSAWVDILIALRTVGIMMSGFGSR